MREELDNRLCTKYPDIFQERQLTIGETAMCWGFQHGDGWYEMLDTLCEKLTLTKKTFGVGAIATTVKEKYGTLRFYVRYQFDDSKNPLSEDDKRIAVDLVEDLITVTENESCHVCEECGAHASTRKWGTWVYTRCYACWRVIMNTCYGLIIPENECDYDEWVKTREQKKLIEKTSASLENIHYISSRFTVPNWQDLALKDTISALRAIHSECEQALPILKDLSSKLG